MDTQSKESTREGFGGFASDIIQRVYVAIAFSLPFRQCVIYYPPEVRRGEYWGLGVFLLHTSLMRTITF